MSHSLSCELEDGGPQLPGQRLCAFGVLWECTPLRRDSCLQGSPPGKETPAQTLVPGALYGALVVPWALQDTSLQLREGMQASPGGAEFRGVGGLPIPHVQFTPAFADSRSGLAWPKAQG